MNKSNFIVIYLLLVLGTTTTVGGVDDQNPKTLNAAERGIGISSPMIISPWQSTIRSWFKVAWLHLRPPDAEVPYHPGEMMKEAVSKSFETTKEAAMQSTKVAGDAVHKTAEKVKRSVSTAGGSTNDHDEL